MSLRCPNRAPAVRASSPASPVGLAATRCLLVPNGFVDADLCGQLHLSGTAVLHAIGDPRLIVPAALNQPHRHRLDAYGLALPEHTATIEHERLVVRGPAGIATGPLGTETAIGARIDPDGFIVPAHD